LLICCWPQPLACELIETRLADALGLSTLDYALLCVTPGNETPWSSGSVRSRAETGLPWGGEEASTSGHMTGGAAPRRQWLEEEQLAAPVQESLSVAHKTGPSPPRISSGWSWTRRSSRRRWRTRSMPGSYTRGTTVDIYIMGRKTLCHFEEGSGDPGNTFATERHCISPSRRGGDCRD
jgi:hypothetical protein